MTYIGRFAPSPTGDLHLGSLVAALGSWLRARQADGAWRVRIEDIDPPREVAGSARRILAALDRFGLEATGSAMFQSTRLAAYDAAFEALRTADALFLCRCSRTALAADGGRHRDGCCRADDASAAAPAAWRLRVGDHRIHFQDAVFGAQQERLADTAGDFVIRRNDGLYSYQLAVVVDDAAQGVSEVVRGADLLESTARQIFLQQLLGLPTPSYVHLPLVVDNQGRKLSKSEGVAAVDLGDPITSLRVALGFLGVIDFPADCRTVADHLAIAVDRFDLKRLRSLLPDKASDRR